MTAQTVARRVAARARVGLLSALTTTAVASGQEGSLPSERAQRILEASGVKGGLIVHLGCGDGRLTAALGRQDGFLVHGLDADANKIAKAREHVHGLGLYGKVSVERWTARHLPYIDNLVNLIVAERGSEVPTDELLRVLVPNGVAYLERGDKWTRLVKPRPKDIDTWTHYLHDASGNAVAQDTVVGPPGRLQWIGSPTWARHHDRMASMSALVSSGERIFYIMDEGSRASIQLPPQWALVARDAFNGTILWRRPIASWHTHLWPYKSGPAQLPRRLVAVGERVYVTLGLDAPVTALDAATGATIRTYAGSEATEELIASEGILFLLADTHRVEGAKYSTLSTCMHEERSRVARQWTWDARHRHVMAVEAETGRVLWTQPHRVVPLTLAVGGKRVFFHNGEQVVALNRESGKELWRSAPVSRKPSIPTNFGATLVAREDVVLFSGGNRSMAALSPETGETLWTARHPRSGHNSPEDLLVVDGLVWSGAIARGQDSGVFTGRDPRTGEIKKQFAPDVQTYWFHQRCYRSKAAGRYLLPSRTGIEFVDTRSEHWIPHHWVRGGCIYGVMPCNGLIYAPPHACACYIDAKLNGFCALAPTPTRRPPPGAGSEQDRFDRGPGYGKTERPSSPSSGDADWPTYRHDPARSGFTKSSIPAGLRPLWDRELGGKVSSPVIAGGRVFVASVHAHTIHSLDAKSGATLWRYTVGGRVDSPPTVYQGRVLFGSADGWVYCLRAADGALVWRFRAAPQDRRMTAYGQLESVWPVHGSVLVYDDVVYCVAGRSMFVDGGLRLCRLDPRTGRKLSETILDDRDPTTGGNLQTHVRGLNMPAALPDVLASDGRYVYMRTQRFDLQGVRRQIAPTDVVEQQGEGVHLFCGAGFLDESSFHRAYWMFGKSIASGASGWFLAGRAVPAGRLLVLDDRTVYGFGRKPKYFRWSTPLEHHLFAIDRNHETLNLTTGKPATKAEIAQRPEKCAIPPTKLAYRWSRELPLHVRAMVLANRTLVVAGPPDLVDEEEAFRHRDRPEIRERLRAQDDAFEGRRGGLLWVVATADGRKLREIRLASPPAWDGMAVADGRVFLSTMDGHLVCLGDD